MAPQVYLHMGAHRTGSSSFQMCLGQNADAIRAEGYDVLYPSRDGAPNGRLRLRLPLPRFTAEENTQVLNASRGMLQDELTGAPRVILSEENLPGIMMALFKGKFYPDARKRLTYLRDMLPGPVANLLLVVRPYDSFYASAWRLRAQDNLIDPFDEVRHRFLDITRGWHDLVTDAQEVLSPEHVTVVDFRHRPSSADLVRELVPDLRCGLQEVKARVNTSPSDAAILECQARMRDGEKITPKLLKQIAAAHAKAPRQFRFSKVERAHLLALYAQHLDRLAALPGVTVKTRGAESVDA